MLALFTNPSIPAGTIDASIAQSFINQVCLLGLLHLPIRSATQDIFWMIAM